MTKEALKLALEALEVCEQSNYGRNWVWPDTAHPTAMANVKEAIISIKEALAQPEQEPANYKELLNKSEARLHEVAVHCERVERRLREVNTAAMRLTSDLTCMEVDDDERLDRDRVMGRVMQWRNEWDKAMFKEKNT